MNWFRKQKEEMIEIQVDDTERRIIVRYRGGVGTHAASAPCKLFGSTATNRILLEQYTYSVPY